MSAPIFHSPTTTTPNPLDPQCEHQQFHAEVNVIRDTLNVHVRVKCVQCGRHMTFPETGTIAILKGIL